jgi:tRNA(Ile)-lysidine synthase
MHPFVKGLLTEWRRLTMPFREATIIVAVSGGADSVSLLLALDDLRTRKKLDIRLVAAHFNHKLRGAEADADEEFVRQLTKQLKIEFAAGRGDVPADGNLEQNARLARYEFLRKTALGVKAYAVVTGHTMNDQAETVLMNLVRGSGPGGLSGMRSVRQLWDEPGLTSEKGRETNTLLVRPLLRWAKRLSTEGFCRDMNVGYRYDTMNEDTAFRRVRIRKVLLPLLEDMNPKIIETLSNTALLMQNLVDGQASVHAKNDGDAALDLEVLRTLNEAERLEYLRTWLNRCRGTARQLELKHIRGVERLAVSKRSGRVAEVPGGRVVKSGGRLSFEENEVEN